MHPLADDRVGLRLPRPSDARVLHAYASRDGGLDGGWAPLPADATLADCRAVVADWLAGWRNERSFHGPALIVTTVGEATLVGLMALIDRGGQVAELSYGIAQDRRGRGHARAAVRLAGQWLLRDRLADLVELHIHRANTASQRTALAAGFTQTPAVAGNVGDDLRFVLRRR